MKKTAGRKKKINSGSWEQGKREHIKQHPDIAEYAWRTYE